MSYLFANNANSIVDVPLKATDTQLYIKGDDAELFPQPSDEGCGSFFMVTLEDLRTGQREICKCIARAGRRLTIDRAEEDTVAQAFAYGAKVSHRVTRDTLYHMIESVDEFHNIWLGVHAEHPVVGPDGCTLKVGMMYFNIITKHIYIWDGTDWISDADNPLALDSKLYYYVDAANDGQTIFRGEDIFGNTMALNEFAPQPIHAHVNGVEIVPDGGTQAGDYIVDYPGNRVVLQRGVPKGSIVSFSLFTNPDTMRPAGMVSWPVRPFNIDPATGIPDYFDGVRTTFLILDDETGNQLFPRSARELIVSMDGVLQQPGVDFLVSAGEITFATPPLPTARPWAFLYGAPGQGAGGTIDHTQLINRDRANQHPINGITGLQNALDGKAPINHTHDAADIPDLGDTYYTITEVDTLLLNKSDINHTHTVDEITDISNHYYSKTEIDAGIALPPGGAIHTVLTKLSGTDGDYDWGFALEVVTQAEYDAGPKDANTIYFILEQP